MSTRYEPKDHIQHLEVAPRSESILDQREITIQSYQTTIPFDFEALNAGLESAWLTPQIRFGLFARNDVGGKDALHVVLGLQDELSVRAYDYDERRPLWFSWQDIIVDTVGVRYFRDEEGLLRFTTTGGGRRITDERLDDFNSAFLKIPKDAVSKRQFDLEKLRDLCFTRFVERLYMIKFSGPSAEEYRSIDHTSFKSRLYIDPNAGRLKEIRSDAQVKVESFDSDLPVRSEELAGAIQVRFFIGGTSGALRLRFPKMTYKNQITTVEDQARVFYHVVDVTVSSILDADYYTQQRRSLDELDTDLGLFPDLVDLTKFREVLINAEARKELLDGIDVASNWVNWVPHLRALDELLVSNVVAEHVAALLGERARGDPGQVSRLLAACQADAKMHRVGALSATALARELQAVPAETRAQIEEAILSWAIDKEQESWDVDPETGELGAMTLRWRLDDLTIDIIPAVLWKLVGLLHARLVASHGDTGPLLRRFDWCMTAARALPPNHSKNPAALRLVAKGRIPRTIAEASKVLKQPVTELRALDEAVLNEFGLPLWPSLTAVREGDKVVITNHGVGAALAVTAHPAGQLQGVDGAPAPVDIISGAAVSLPMSGTVTALDVTFEKHGGKRRVTVPVSGEASATDKPDIVRVLPEITINRKRIASQRAYRQKIDQGGIVVGASPALLEVFEGIHHANLMDGAAAVLLLGERGTGKTHIAKLIHASSSRANRAFVERNAGGAGGDLNIQRGEWIGYGKNHGVQGIERNGKAGHLMAANGGTLFVDELAELSSDLQVIFLSVLEGRPIEKVGGESFTPNVRCIFATNADLDKAVADRTLRADLLDRITTRITIPPLRDRRGDILLLARHFAGAHRVTDRCLVGLLRHDWPGNVRGLHKEMERAVAKMTAEGAAAVDLSHTGLPAALVSAVEALDEDSCKRELWTLADKIAQAEGFERRDGLQKRAGEIMGVGEAQASKMYRAFGLAGAGDSAAASTA